jgi:hypothetical protein
LLVVHGFHSLERLIREIFHAQ